MQEVRPAIFLLLIIIIGTILIEWIAIKKLIPIWLSKKIVQLIIGTSFALAPLFFYHIYLLQIIIALIGTVGFFAAKNEWLALNDKGEKNWGIFYLSISFLLLLLSFGQFKQFFWVMIYAMLVLALSDSLSAIIGHFSNNKFKITTDKKSFLGSTVFFIVTWFVLTYLPVCLYSFNPYFHLPAIFSGDWNKWMGYAAGLAFILTILEAICSNELGNLLIPLCTALIVYATFRLGTLHPSQLLVTMVLATVVAVVSYFKGALTLNGSVTAWFMGIVLLWMGDWEWVWPMMAFFITGTVFTRINNQFGRKSDEDHDKPRDYYQVLANGGIGLLCCVLFAVTGTPFWYYIYVFSISVSMADTCSSEIGMMADGKVVDLLSRKPVPRGVSGGVSSAGFVGGFMGALIIGWIGFSSRYFSITLFGITLLAGLLGTLLDSILGSKMQVKYKLANGQPSDFIPDGEQGTLLSGQKWMTNDMVNFLTNLIITLLCFWIMFW